MEGLRTYYLRTHRGDGCSSSNTTPLVGLFKVNQPLDIEVEMLKSRVESLEIQSRWLHSKWVEWTKSTKDMGQKIMISLEQIVNKELPTPPLAGDR